MPDKAPPAYDLRARCDALPVFPLPRMVFIPHTLLPLHIFEPRYRALVRDALDADGLMGVPMLAPGWRDEYDSSPALHPVMGVGRIVRHQSLPDGCSNIVLLGLGRARVLGERDTDVAYRVVHAELLEDPTPAPGALAQAALRLRVAVGQLARARPESADQLSPLLEPDRPPGQVADALAHLALRDPLERQSYLELPGPVSRIDRAIEAISGMLFHGAAPTA